MKNKYYKFLDIYNNRKKYELEKKFIWSRFYFDNFSFDKRVNFVIEMIKESLKEEFILEIKFWDNNILTLDFFKNLTNRNSILEEYKGEESPGIIIVYGRNLELSFFIELLQSHYNYELAEDPSLNIKVLLFIDTTKCLKIYDFYDDRGFIVNFYFE